MPKVDLPDWMPIEAWDGFVEMRRKSKKPFTDRAAQLIVKKLDEFRQQGHDPGEVLDRSTVNGWQGIFPLKNDRNGPLAHNVTPFPSRMSRDEENRRASMDFLRGLANG